MTEPGDRRPAQAPPLPVSPRRAIAPWPASRAIVVAAGAGLLAALAWATLRSVFDITVGSLVVAALGGWGIGASLRRAGRWPVLAALLAVTAWLAALLLAWLVAMAVLPGSTRSLTDRLASTPFLDWLMPQLGIIEVGALGVWVAAALIASRPARRLGG